MNDDEKQKKATRDEMIEQINAQLAAGPVQIALAVICILVFIGFIYYGFFSG